MSEAASPQIGPFIKAYRKSQSLTLDDLEKISGVSRSMLSQIERGQANPSLATVWSLAIALKVDISELVTGSVTDRRSHIELSSASFTPEMKTEDGSCILRILSPPDHAELLEWYDLVLLPMGSLESKAHAKGMREHLTVLEGTVEVTSGDQIVEVTEGATARYPADLPHAIRNRRNKRARALLVMTTNTHV